MRRLHWGYLIAGVVLAAIVFVASLLVFPASGKSLAALLALGALVAAGVVGFLANWRKAFEAPAGPAIADQADIRLEILGKGFSPSSGNDRSPFPEVPIGPYGFTEQGLPGWCYLWANIKATNIGPEEGSLAWELDKAKTKLPSLFVPDRSKAIFAPPISRLEARTPSRTSFYLHVPLAERDPHAFAQSLKALVKSKQRYRIVLRYKTLRLCGESQVRRLVIEGDFQDLYQKVLHYWGEGEFKGLADLARM